MQHVRMLNTYLEELWDVLEGSVCHGFCTSFTGDREHQAVPSMNISRVTCASHKFWHGKEA